MGVALIRELTAPTTPHPAAPVLKAFPLIGVAKHLGISRSYLSAVLNGGQKASDKLEQRINLLVEKVQNEMKDYAKIGKDWRTE